MNRILTLLAVLILAAATARADVAIEKDDTFPSTTSISTKHENQGPWRIVMLDRDEDVITATFYITSLKPMTFDKTKNGVFTIDGINLPAKLVTAKKTAMTDYNLAAGQFDLSPLKDKFLAARTVTVTCFFNTGMVVTWDVSPEVIDDWRVVFLLPEGGKPAKPKGQTPATKPGTVKSEPPKAATSQKPVIKPTPPPSSIPPAASSPTPSTAPAQQGQKESPAPAPAAQAAPTAKPAAPPQQEKPQSITPAKQAPAEPEKPAAPEPPASAPAATQSQPAVPAAAPEAAPPNREAGTPPEMAEKSTKETPAETKPATAAPPPPRPLWQPHAPQPTQNVKQPQSESALPVSGGVQTFDDEDKVPPSIMPADKSKPNPAPASPAATGETK